MPRGPCWSQHEVGRLLAQIRGSREVTLLMASTSRPNEALWRDIARRLSAEGYERSVSQCRAKWKKLKQSFYSDWASRRRGGAQALCTPAHYRIMKRLWKAAGRPVFGVRRLPVYSLGMLQVKDEDVDDDEDEEEILRPSSATMPWDMRSSEEQGGLSCPELSPLRQAGHSLSDFRSPISEDRYSYLYNSADPPGCALPLVKSEPQNCSDSVYSHLLSMKQEALDQGTELNAEQDQETLSSMPGEETELEDPSVAADLQGPAVVSLLQNMQQILAQLLHTSQQQQILLESLASDTVSHLHLISDNLVYVGETLHELLNRVHNCDDIQ